MTTINFLQPQPVQKPRRISRMRLAIACVISIASLLAGNSSQARVPEDFMERPVILFPAPHSVIPSDQLEIRGTAHNWAHVDITINGSYAGRATTKNGKGSNAVFSLKPKMLPAGIYWIQASVRSENEVFRSPLTTSVLVQIVEPTPAPTLLTLAGSGDARRPYIRGVAAVNTRVDIFIDNKLDQSFEARGKESVVSFSVQPRSPLADGFHTVTAKSTGLNGVTSKPSNQRVFLVEASGISRKTAPGLTGKPSPGPSTPAAPTLLEPRTGSVINTRNARVQGLAHNGLTIQVYVDGVFDQEVPVTSHPSGTGSFSFTTRDLESGSHSVSAIARDNQGRISSRSNELEFLVAPEGRVQRLTRQGESFVWFPALSRNEPIKTPAVRGIKPQETKTTTPPSQPVGGSVRGDTPTATTTSTRVAQEKTEVSVSPETDSDAPARIPARVLIGWIILGMSLVGIIAYMVSAILERRKNKTNTQTAANQRDAKQSLSQKTPVVHDQTKKTSDDDFGSNDDIPKGYQ